ncbi:MAG: hypothetical protein KUG78_08485 [Kangiellaceae bacterium]|nr:hypothetical protein [Kangiellaceae bacterium]
MNKELLIINLKESGSNAPSWDFMPNDLWEYIVRNFLIDTCDSFSLDCVTGKGEIGAVSPFSDYQPQYLSQNKYSPFSIPSHVKDPKNYLLEQPAFEFNGYVANLMLQVEFGCWCVSNEDTPADELVFWQGGQEKVLAVPYEGMIFFSNLTADERANLLSVDQRIKANLHNAA